MVAAGEATGATAQVADGAAGATARDGSFRIEAPAEARLRLVATGFLDGVVTLHPGRERDLGMLVLRRELSLSGRLVVGGAPLAGAEVVVPTGDEHGMAPPSLRATTDAEGRFRLAGIRPESLSALRIVAGGVARVVDLGHGLHPLEARHHDLGDVEVVPARAVRGRVVDAAGFPVAGVTVGVAEFRAADGIDDAASPLPSPSPVASTGEDGGFELLLLDGRTTLLAYREGRGFARLDVETGPATAEAGSIVLEGGGAAGGRVIYGDGRSAGTVGPDSLPDGGPAAGVPVTLEWVEGWPGWGRLAVEAPVAVTDDAGCYRFAGLPPGAGVGVSAGGDGLVAASGIARGTAGTGPTEDGSCGSVEEIVLERTAGIVGTVVDPAGAPVTDAGITAYRVDGRGGMGPPPATTGADGRFELTGLRAGDYDLIVSAHGHLSTTVGSVPAPAGEVAEVPIELTPVAERVALEVRVIDDRGVPVPEAKVTTGLQANNRPAPTISPEAAFTGADGRVVFAGAPAGVYSMRADVAATAEYTGWQSPFRIGPGAASVELRVPAPREPVTRLGGRLLDARGEGINGAVLHLERDAPRRDAFRGITGAGGAFRFDAVPAGDYLLKATRRDMPEFVLDRPIEVRSTPVEDVVVTVPEPGLVRGRVEGLAEAGLEAAELDGLPVHATSTIGLPDGPSASIAATGRVDAAGGFRVAGMSPGAWRLSARIADGREATTEVVIEEPGQVVDARLVFPSGFTLTGRVLWRGQPAESPSVGFVSLESGESRRATTDARGRFRVEAVPPGRHRVSVAIPELRSPFWTFVDVEGDASLDLVVRGGAVAGVVVDASSGEPVPLAHVRTDPVDPEVYIAHGFDEFHRADRDGRFTVGPFHAGPWRFQVTAPGYARREPVIEIGDEDVSGVRIELSRSPGLVVRFHPQDGTLPRILDLTWQDEATAETYNVAAFPRSSDSREFRWDGIPLGAGVLTVTNYELFLATRLDVVNGGEVVDVPLQAGARLELTVEGLEPSVGATLRLHDVEGRPFSHRGVSEWQRRASGEFRVLVVPAGVYRAEVTAEDGRTWSERLILAPYEMAEVVLGR